MTANQKKAPKKVVAKEFLGEVFRHETLECAETGAYLHGPEFEAAYRDWLNELYKSKRAKFQIQCHFGDSLMRCADSYLVQHPGVATTVFFRILATSYITIIDGDEKLSERFDGLLDANVYDSFVDSDGRTRVSIQFKPAMMVDIVATSEVLEMKMSQIVEESILKMMTAIVSQEPEMRAFWRDKVSAMIDVMLKSA